MEAKIGTNIYEDLVYTAFRAPCRKKKEARFVFFFFCSD